MAEVALVEEWKRATWEVVGWVPVVVHPTFTTIQEERRWEPLVENFPHRLSIITNTTRNNNIQTLHLPKVGLAPDPPFGERNPFGVGTTAPITHLPTQEGLLREGRWEGEEGCSQVRRIISIILLI